MFDRLPGPGKEGRVKITPEGGGAPFYAIMEMADEPTQVGTPLNKATLLSDATAAAAGDSDTVSEAIYYNALVGAALKVGKANSFSTFELIQRGLI